jgi:hypothetical protein
MRRKTAGALAAGAAVVGLVMTGFGTAEAADPSCLVESTEHSIEDPVGSTADEVSDPTGTLDEDVKCVHEVLGEEEHKHKHKHHKDKDED